MMSPVSWACMSLRSFLHWKYPSFPCFRVGSAGNGQMGRSCLYFPFPYLCIYHVNVTISMVCKRQLPRINEGGQTNWRKDVAKIGSSTACNAHSSTPVIQPKGSSQHFLHACCTCLHKWFCFNTLSERILHTHPPSLLLLRHLPKFMH